MDLYETKIAMLLQVQLQSLLDKAPFKLLSSDMGIRALFIVNVCQHEIHRISSFNFNFILWLQIKKKIIKTILNDIIVVKVTICANCTAVLMGMVSPWLSSSIMFLLTSQGSANCSVELFDELKTTPFILMNSYATPLT